jgi:hypothetical protein
MNLINELNCILQKISKIKSSEKNIIESNFKKCFFPS